MAYSAEVVKRARAKLAQMKADRESENRHHLAEAYEKVPRIRQIDQQLRQTMALAAQAAFTQGGNAQQLLAQAREENLSLQQERTALVAAHFPEGWLDEVPVCSNCGGNGYIGTQMCRCLSELCRQEQKQDLALLSGNSESFQQFRLDYYSDQYDPKYGVSPRMLMERHLRTCRTYAGSFCADSGNLLFIGGTGLGKTFLSACIARTVADRGYSVMYESAGNLFAKLEQARFNATDDTRREAELLRTCDLLIIDDLGTEMPSQFVTASLYSLLNDRLQRGLPMIVSTNLNVDELSRRYSPQIASRLHGNFQQLIFLGEDIRVMKNRGL
jgi:DNA replication protein DnaC